MVRKYDQGGLDMFLTFLLFILYMTTTVGMLACLGLAIFFLFKAKQELDQPREFVEILKDPTILLSERGFSVEGNRNRLLFLQFLGISLGLIALILLFKLMLG